jgi:LPLT family lysophospholipid transporter-like MFS transporter
MVGTLCAQFLSALGDNALLFAALALVRQQGFPSWSGPLLQEFFVATYILLAPFVGAFADATPKGRVMLIANSIKFAGGLGMCLHVNPFVSYALVGMGAAANSPAKYGILGELTAREQLVKANGLLEASTIAAILLGSVAVFAAQAHTLLKNQPARLALVGTGLFWGAGAALRFLVIAWVPVALKVTNNRTPGFLTAMVAVGIVAGAGLAAQFVPMRHVNRALPAGILIGVGVCLLPLAHSLPLAYALMAFVGLCSGLFLVPLDALLQKQGKDSVGAGSAIAIQNFFENFSMLALVSGYTAATYFKIPVNTIAVGFGASLAVSMIALTATQRLRIGRR